jgi:hypothetical protein
MESRPTVMTQKISPREILEIRARFLSSVLEQLCFILKFSKGIWLGLRRLRIAIAIIETESWGISDFCQIELAGSIMKFVTSCCLE